MPNPTKSALACAMIALVVSPVLARARSEPEPGRSRLLLEPGAPWKLSPPGQLRQAGLIEVAKPRPQPPLTVPGAVQARRETSPRIEWMFAIDVPSAPVIDPGRLLWSMDGRRGVARTFVDGLDLGASPPPDGQLLAPSLVGLTLFVR